MQKFNIDELKPHEKNNYFFDDISGDKWEEFLHSIKTSGVIEPIVISTDKIIVSGHQRVRACKELGITEIMAKIKNYDNDDSIIKDLLETNIRQRGSVSGSTVKLGRRIRELERIYGIKHGNNQHNEDSANGTKLTQEDLANQLGIKLDVLKRAKSLTSLPQEIQDLVEQGNITPSTAARVITKLSPEEQEDLLKSLPVTKKLTQKEIENYIVQLKEKDNQITESELKLRKIKALENEIKDLNIKLQERPVIEKEIVPSDYEDIKTSNKNFQADYKNPVNQYENKISEISELKNQISTIMNDARDKAGLGSKVSCTKKSEYQRCIDFIESWNPKYGCKKLKNVADNRARARLEAKKLGYES